MSAYAWTWVAIVGSGVAMWLVKAVGHRVPEHALDNPRLIRIASLVTVALLTALAILQTLTSGRSLVLDARVPALLVAAVLLWRRAPFIVVVAAAAVVAAALRALG